ncbi:hypothetical protein ACTXT7_011901 [Hymenolepis weldensis]
MSQFDLGSQGCNRMLMQMRHCSLCAGYPLVHPCPSFCETSLTHCLRPINKLQPPWTDLINTLYEQLQDWLNPSGLMLKNIIIYSPKAILEFQRVIVKSVQDVCGCATNSVLSALVRAEASQPINDQYSCNEVLFLRTITQYCQEINPTSCVLITVDVA